MSLADLLVLSPEFRTRSFDMVPLETAVTKIKRAFPDVETKIPNDTETIVQRVAASARTANWQAISTGDVAIALLASLLEELPIPNDLQTFLTAEAIATTNPRLLDAIARAYLETWSSGSTKTSHLHRLLIARADKLPNRWQNLFLSCPEFLDIEAGPQLIGNRMATVVNPYHWLIKEGLPAPHGSGFMESAHTAFLAQNPNPKTIPALDKLLSWAAPADAAKLDDKRSAEVIDCILSPWTTASCPPDYRETCIDRLITLFGDPRRDNPAFWNLVAAPHRRVLNKWLARKSMEAMFQVVTEAEQDTQNNNHWPGRRRFWMSLYEDGRIDEAWFALGDDIIPIANKLHQRTGDKSYLSFGRQIPRKGTCLLFIRIGEKIFVEGSHNFRIHTFPNPIRPTPQLYASSYNINEILLPKPHADARVHTGDWKGWVRDRIKQT